MSAGTDHLERLVKSLLYEGYALYPYTRGTTKNATPTPFGIVYPRAYARAQLVAYDRMQLECVCTDADAPLSAEVRFLQASGDRHRGTERKMVLAAPGTADFEFGAVRGRLTLAVVRLPDGRGRVTLRVENTTEMAAQAARAMARSEALLSSLLSTHLLCRVSGGASFVSPLERGDEGVAGCTNVNTWPVLAAADDTAILGPTIMLPDHPQIAPESVNDFFDGTEIEEALVLHVHTLTDAEREDIASQDPAVREMLERAGATTPQQLMDLHGRVRIEDPPGERQAAISDGIVGLGDKVVLRPKRENDVYDTILEGRVATVGRIYLDDADRAHLGVTVDDDPMQEILTASGRFLFFFPYELEVADVREA